MEQEQLEQELVQEYLDQLSDKETVAIAIAKQILGDSYSLTLSNGFIAFMKSRKLRFPHLSLAE